jgi:hypothetical protein
MDRDLQCVRLGAAWESFKTRTLKLDSVPQSQTSKSSSTPLDVCRCRCQGMDGCEMLKFGRCRCPMNSFDGSCMEMVPGCKPG